MTYNTNPIPGQTEVRKTYNNLNVNALTINALIDIDHFSFSEADPSKRGFHKVVHIQTDQAFVKKVGTAVIFSEKISEGDPEEDKSKTFILRDLDEVKYPVQAMRAFATIFYENATTISITSGFGIDRAEIESPTGPLVIRAFFVESLTDEFYTVIMGNSSTATNLGVRSKSSKYIDIFSSTRAVQNIEFMVLRGF